MITETREIYKCGFCRKLYQIKKWAEIHEKGCTKNPKNWRKCFGCVHLHKTEADYTCDTYFGEETVSVSVLHCKAKDVYIHPPKVEAKKNWFDFGDKANESMPMECDLFDDGMNS
jgi:hypothetical protein